MGRWYSRSAWNARPRRHPPGRLDPADVRGLALHWPGTSSTRPISRRAVPRALRNWQDYHMDGHGWSDIAYQAAVDQWGRKWELRGLGNRSAANGGWEVNGEYGAVLLILVNGESPSLPMLESTREIVRAHRAMFPRSRQIVGHGAIRPGGWTECPGRWVRDAIHDGLFEPNRGRDDYMPTAKEIAEAIMDAPLPAHNPKGRREVRDVIVREALTASMLELEATGAPRVQKYLADARKSDAPK